MTPHPLNDKPWYTYVSLDLLIHVLNRSIFHPFIACLIPLCLRATAVDYSATSFIYTSAWAALVCLFWLLAPINERIAFGAPRPVRFGTDRKQGVDQEGVEEVEDEEEGEEEEDEEVIVITGGASGLGRCLAEIYALRGLNVAVMDVKSHKMVEGLGEIVRYYECDVGNKEKVEETWKQIIADLGTPTILISNAAIVHGLPFLSLDYSLMETTLRTNTLSTFHLASLFLPPLLSPPRNHRGGTLVTISSILGHPSLGAARLADYTASKAALGAFHNSLRAELAQRDDAKNIKTILVTPGQLSTDLFAGVRLSPLQRFFGPVVEVKDIAMRIVETIDAGKGGVICEPAYARWIGGLELLPWGLQIMLRRWCGIDRAMDGFRPRVGTGEGEVQEEKM